jgi:RNA polymerase sigma-70 factor (ECF subfamily)
VEGDLEAARRGEHDAFARLVAPFRRELRAHCYRMAGTLHDADDLLQESLVRAWRGLTGFAGRASLRTWLYKVTTHACLDRIGSRSAREIEPAPPDVYDVAPSPEARYSQREAVALAFMVALQLLTPKQRAVLILFDVVGLEASECAELLDLSVGAVTSALQRARDAIASQRSPAPAVDPDAIARYLDAWERADTGALIALLAEDARLAMPPLADTYTGAAAIGAAIGEMVFAPAGAGAFRFVAVEAAGVPAYAAYLRDGAGWKALALHVVETAGGRVTSITAFMDPALFERFGLAATL